MAMAERDQQDRRLEDFFAAARDRAPDPSEALMARILADAEAARRLAAVARPSEGLWARLGAMLGGWQGIGGLATATAAGLWIGYAGLADPAELSGGLVGAAGETVELMPEVEVFVLAAGTEG